MNIFKLLNGDQVKSWREAGQQLGKLRWTLILISLLFLIGCSTENSTPTSSQPESESGIDMEQATTAGQVTDTEQTTTISEASEMTTYLICNEEKFELLLEDNQTAQALKERFPLSIEMDDLHQNEKYNYLNEELPTNPTAVKKIEKGDVMLFGSDCLVIFYKSFETSYSYTRVGKIKNPEEISFLENEKTVRISIEEQKE